MFRVSISSIYTLWNSNSLSLIENLLLIHNIYIYTENYKEKELSVKKIMEKRMEIEIENNYYSLDIETLPGLMGDTTPTRPGTGAGRRPGPPSSSFSLVRVQHKTARQMALPMLSAMSFVPQFYVMLEQKHHHFSNAILAPLRSLLEKKNVGITEEPTVLLKCNAFIHLPHVCGACNGWPSWGGGTA